MRLALVSALAAVSTLALSAPALADTLVDNVDGVTIDAEGKVKRFNGLVFDEDGKITAVLTRSDKRPQADYRLDGEGRVMLPGMIDAHVHVMDMGFAALTLDLSETTSLAQAQAKIAAYAAAHPDRPWILGRGWNQELWPEKRFPTAAELDAVVPDRPVWLGRVDGHAVEVDHHLAVAVGGVEPLEANPALGQRLGEHRRALRRAIGVIDGERLGVRAARRGIEHHQ